MTSLVVMVALVAVSLAWQGPASASPTLTSVDMPLEQLPEPERQLVMDVPNLSDGEYTVQDAPRSLRAEILHDELGYSYEQLDAMTPQQIQTLIEQRADDLEIKVFRLTSAPGEEPVYTQVAGPETVYYNPLQPAWGTDLEPRSYLPVIIKSQPYVPPTPTPTAFPPPPISPWPLFDAMYHAFEFLRDLVYSDGEYAFVSEHVGAPLAINMPTGSGPWPRLAGHYLNNRWEPVGEVTWYAVGDDYEMMTVTFEGTDTNPNFDYDEPEVWLDRHYDVQEMPGTTKYVVTVSRCDGTCHGIELWFGNTLVHWNLGEILLELPRHFVIYVPNPGRVRTHRYMVRIGGAAGRRIFNAFDWLWADEQIGRMMYDYGYVWDGYDPIFGVSGSRPDDFVFQPDAFHDCTLEHSGMAGVQPWGLVPHQYPYESKVCLSVPAWITLSRQDYISTQTQAIHILNKYNDPDYEYPDPRDGIGTVTPREIARWIENTAWNGHGVPYFLRDQDYASGLRTDLFLILESLLAFKFDDWISQYFVEAIVERMPERLWGVQKNYLPDQSPTVEWGWLLRPNWRYAPYYAWRESEVDGKFEFGSPDPTYVQELLDIANMPREVRDMGPVTVSETTMTYIQALRVYLFLAYGPGGPMDVMNPILLPRMDTYLWGGYVNPLHVNTTIANQWTATDLLDELAAQGLDPEWVETGYRPDLGRTPQRCYVGSCPDDFPLRLGYGVLVKVNNTGWFRIPGQIAEQSAPLTFQAGEYTYIGVVDTLRQLVSAHRVSTLRTLLEKRGCGDVTIWRYNMPGQQWEAVDVFEEDYQRISPYRAYMVRTSATCSAVP
ncbi:MAG: hypothetical protein Kow0047_23450 [Anaerolineae bacterium]